MVPASTNHRWHLAASPPTTQTAPCGATINHTDGSSRRHHQPQTAPCDTTTHGQCLATPPSTTDGGALCRQHQPQTAHLAAPAPITDGALQRRHHLRMGPCSAGTIYGWGLAAPAPTNAWTYANKRTHANKGTQTANNIGGKKAQQPNSGMS